MPKFSVSAMPEIFVSDTTISKAVSAAVERRQLRKIGSRLYTRNLDEDPQRLVRQNWYYLDYQLLSGCPYNRPDST